MTDEELLAKACEFELLTVDPSIPFPKIRSIGVVRRSLPQHDPSWAIVDEMGSCLNHNGTWEWESLPSSRTEKFIRRCRWPELREAVAFAEDHMAKYPTGYKDLPPTNQNPISLAEMLERRKKKNESSAE